VLELVREDAVVAIRAAGGVDLDFDAALAGAAHAFTIRNDSPE
jgi:hypothetical protein